MGDIVNLRRARKAKIRADAELQADVNRAVFGRTKADKHQAAEDRARTGRFIDGHRREPDDGTRA